MRPGAPETLGVYVHVPFCVSRCVYCDFYVETGRESFFDDYARALVTEWGLLRRDLLGGAVHPVTTIYFGGGTPSLLEPGAVARLIEEIAATSSIAPDVEVTLEANPESVTGRKARDWRAAGVNRISLGVQSFDPADLEALQRPHSVAQARAAVRAVRAAGFARLSLDLIYGIRPDGSASYRRSLEAAAEIDPGHISSYLLTVEDGTPLGRLVRGGRWSLATDDDAEADYAFTRDLLAGRGYAAYEISNFARPGHESRHNGRYWLREPYLGLGPGAHSFFRDRRWGNVAHLGRYLDAVLSRGERPETAPERVDAKKAVGESIFLGLRRTEGIAWDALRGALDGDEWTRLEATRARLERDGFLVDDGGRVRLADDAVFVSNAVIVELLGALDAEAAEAVAP